MDKIVQAHFTWQGMTYCLGWKTGHDIIVAADAAITTPKNAQEMFTSFGESSHTNSKGERVEEQALKSFRVGDSLVITYAGNVRVALSTIHTIEKAVSEGFSALEAVNQGLAANIDQANPKIKLIFGFLENGASHLYSFNIGTKLGIQEHDDLVQAGSMPPEYQKMTSDYLAACVENGDTAKHKISKLLGVLQMYSNITPTMADGVGGVYSAVGIGMDGVQLQPEILYTSYDNSSGESLASVFYRHQCVVVIMKNSEMRLFCNSQFDETNQSVGTRVRLAEREAIEQFYKGKFDFVIVQNGKYPAVGIVEMCKKKNHELVRIKPKVIGLKCELGISFQAKITAAFAPPITQLNEKIPVSYYKYDRPSSPLT